MAEISIDPVESWNEIQFIDRPDEYLRRLIYIATKAFPELQQLRAAVINRNWPDANKHMSAVEKRLAYYCLLVKVDLMKRSIDLVRNHISNPSSEQIVTTRLLNYIEMVENSQFIGGKHVKIDISKIASLVGNQRPKKQTENLFLYNSILHPSYRYFCLQNTIQKISTEKQNGARIASDNFCCLIGYRINLTPDHFSDEVLKQEQAYETKYPILPSNFSLNDWTNHPPLTRHVLKKCAPERSVAQIASDCSLRGKTIENILKQINISLATTPSTNLVSDPSSDDSNSTTAKPSMPPPVVVVDSEDNAYRAILIGRKTKISFHRTLRVPEDGTDYPLPADLGAFPIHRIEDYKDSVPANWLKEGGFFIPLFQKEALFIRFEGMDWCPAIAKVCVGMVNAITGKPYSEKLLSHSQDYVVIPKQRWLDGINSEAGTVRQFVAMPLGQGYTVEAQITDEEEHGGFQLVVYESVAGRFKRPELPTAQKVGFLKKQSMAVLETMINRLTKIRTYVINSIRKGATATDVARNIGMEVPKVIAIYQEFRQQVFDKLASDAKLYFGDGDDYQEIVAKIGTLIKDLGLKEDIDPAPWPFPCIPPGRPNAPQSPSKEKVPSISLGSSPSEPCTALYSPASPALYSPAGQPGLASVKEMGIAAGGRIKQQILRDTYGVETWDPNRRRSLKIHMVNSVVYKSITGQDPPPSPISAEQYQQAGVPWFSHYDEMAQSVKSPAIFNRVIGVDAIDRRRGVNSAPTPILHIRPEDIQRIRTPDIDEAIRDLRKLAQGYAEARQWSSALRDIDYLIDLDYRVEASDYVLRSSCNYHLSRYVEGIFDGDHALNIHSENPEAVFWRARCRLAIGDHASLGDDAELLMRIPEAEPFGLELRAVASLLSGRYNDAVYDALYLKKKFPSNQRAEAILDGARVKALQQFKERQRK